MKHSHGHMLLLMFAVTVMFFVVALYAYMYGATSQSVERARVARDTVISEEQDQAQSKTLSNILATTRNDRLHLNSFFVSADNAVSLITMVESLGKQSGSTVALSSISTDIPAGATKGTVGHIHIHVDAHGTWGSVMRLLDLAEQMPDATTVSHVRLVNESSGGQQHTWGESFDIEVLSLVTTSAVSSSN